MAILVDTETRVICQGLTGKQATFHLGQAIADKTRLVAGITPSKGGSTHLGVPVFNTVAEAVAEFKPDASVVFVPPANAADAIVEAIDALVPLIVVITERIPVHDMVRVKERLVNSSSKLVGPNTIGLITPNGCQLGIMPPGLFQRGCIGIISRSGTLTYEVVAQTTEQNLGQSTCIGIGGDMVRGLDFVDCLSYFKDDPETHGVVMIGEAGGNAEEKAAEYLKSSSFGKPVLAYIAGQYAPPGRRMGHAGAIVQHGAGMALGKINRLRAAGVHIADSPIDIGAKIAAQISRTG